VCLDWCRIVRGDGHSVLHDRLVELMLELKLFAFYRLLLARHRASEQVVGHSVVLKSIYV